MLRANRSHTSRSAGGRPSCIPYFNRVSKGVLPDRKLRKESISVERLMCIHLLICCFYGETSLFFFQDPPLSLSLSLSLSVSYFFSFSVSFQTLIFTFHILGLWSVLRAAHHHASRSAQPGATIIIKNQNSPGRCKYADVKPQFFFLNYTSQTKVPCSLQKGESVRLDAGTAWPLCQWTRALRCLLDRLSRAFGFGLDTETFIFCSLRRPQPALCSDTLCLPVFAIFLSSRSPLWSQAFSTVWALLHLSLGAAPSLLSLSLSLSLHPLACLISPMRFFKASPRATGWSTPSGGRKSEILMWRKPLVSLWRNESGAVFFFISA